MRAVVIEAIATLVNIKSTMVSVLLVPAGVPQALCSSLLQQKDQITGKDISKRKFAPLLLDEIERMPNAEVILRKIIRIASAFSKFELSQDEYEARATVQKANEVQAVLQRLDEREAAVQARDREDARKKEERDRALQLRQHLPRLLMMFDAMAKERDHQKRGYLLQPLITDLFNAHEIVTLKSFTRNEGAEQIDGAFRFKGWRYIVECRWRERLADARQLDGLLGQVQRSGKQTMGLFLSIEGWSDHVVPTLKQNPEKSIFLMDGFDLRSVLEGHAPLEMFLDAKLDALNVRAEPFYSVGEYLADRTERSGA